MPPTSTTRALATAHRGDVVILDMPGNESIEARNEVAVELGGVYRETGVHFVILDDTVRPAGLIPLRRLRARRGPTPRWTRRHHRGTSQ